MSRWAMPRDHHCRPRGRRRVTLRGCIPVRPGKRRASGCPRGSRYWWIVVWAGWSASQVAGRRSAPGGVLHIFKEGVAHVVLLLSVALFTKAQPLNGGSEGLRHWRHAYLPSTNRGGQQSQILRQSVGRERVLLRDQWQPNVRGLSVPRNAVASVRPPLRTPSVKHGEISGVLERRREMIAASEDWHCQEERAQNRRSTESRDSLPSDFYE